MDNLRKKDRDIIASLVASGVDYFTIAKAFDLKFNVDEDRPEIVDIGIIPTDPFVIKLADELMRIGCSIDDLHKVTKIPIKELFNLESAWSQEGYTKKLMIKEFEKLNTPKYQYESVLSDF